ncbi:MAG: DUF2834 domain-containing protein [bacterium]
MKRVLLIFVLTAFIAFTITTLFFHAYWDIFILQFRTFAGTQVIIDLVLALSMVLVWMWHDAKSANRNPWPWIVLTLTTGSIGPLIYILIYKTNKSLPAKK